MSPDGKYVAFVVGQAQYADDSYRSGLYVIETKEDARPRCLGTAGPPHWSEINEWVDDAPIWSQDSRYLYYRMDHSGSWQVWRWEASGGEPLQVTHAPRDVTNFELSPDGHQLVLTVTVPAFSPDELRNIKKAGILYDPNIRAWESQPFLDELEEVRRRPPETSIHNIDERSEHRATQDELSKVGPWKSDLPEQQLDASRSLSGHHILSSKISPDGKKVAFLQYFDDPAHGEHDSYELFSKPVRGGNPIALTPAGGNVFQPYWWSANSKEIFYAVSEGNGHSHKLLAIDANGGQPRTLITASNGDWLDGFSGDAAGRFVACSRENNNTPPQLALVNLGTGEVRILVDLNPEFRNVRLGQSFRVEATNKYGVSFYGHVVLPPDYVKGNRYPLVITTYGDADYFLRGAVGDEYPIQVFAANGFVVLNFNSGHDRNFKPGDFDTALLQWDSPVDGMRAAVEKLTEMGIVDENKVAITGLSHGSEFVNYAISHSDFVQVAIASGASSRDPFTFYLAGETFRNDWFRNWGLDGWLRGPSWSRWLRLSTTLNADRIRAPLLINVADSEYLGGLDQVTVMQELGKPFEMFIYPNESHVKNQPRHRYEIYERNVDWLKFWLKDQKDPTPSKKAQYERWQKLRTQDRSLVHPI